MPKPKIPESGIVLGRPGEVARFEAAQLDSIFASALDRSLFLESWRWTVFPVGGLALAFLPLEVKALDARYFYGAYPLLLAAIFGFLRWLPK